MNIEVLFFGQLREITGASRTNVVINDNSRLADLVLHLSNQYGDTFQEKVEGIEGIRILINGREYYLLGRMEAPLSDGNTVVFLPPIAGG
ncbi:MAG: MoaD family protein [Dehalococcoidales bacterium]|nr:MoaD family protein [Dehalococcoidales bacterium]